MLCCVSPIVASGRASRGCQKVVFHPFHRGECRKIYDLWPRFRKVQLPEVGIETPFDIGVETLARLTDINGVQVALVDIGHVQLASGRRAMLPVDLGARNQKSPAGRTGGA